LHQLKIVQITPGTGGLYCGNCLRDNALVAALRQLGYDVVMVPLYLPLFLDEPDEARGNPIFYGGVNVYLEQKSALFRNAPRWLHEALNSKALLNYAADKAVKTRPESAGELTLSMLRGEEGNQAREVNELAAWLAGKADVVCLSNVMLIGMARELKKQVGAPVVCMLAGEDAFLDGLADSLRAAAWATLTERARDVDLFIAPSRYFADVMSRRLRIPAERIQVIPVGINLDGFSPSPAPPEPPVLGFFARMCKEKGLDTLVQAYIQLRQRGRIKDLRLRIGGAYLPIDKAFVDSLKQQLKSAGVSVDVEFSPNLDRAAKQEFLRSLSVLSVPAMYGEAFGLYLLEAWASGVPVVQPKHGAFPEILGDTLGGVLCAPGSVNALTEALEKVLADVISARSMGQAGLRAVKEHYTSLRMAEKTVQALKGLIK
jgi:glycosyltransferase involved in cell wall biosynthesis